MGAMFRFALLVVCGCGRLGFDARSVDELDAEPVTPRACGASTQAPDPLTIDGTTFQFTSFTNDREAIDSVTVEAKIGDAVVAMAISDDAGNYTLSVPTGGTSPVLKLRYAKVGFFTTTVYLDAPLDHSIARGDPALLGPSDGPLWGLGGMGSVYSSANTTRDDTAGTLNINVVDCDEQPLAGVAVALDTTPEVFSYLGTDGKPALAATATIAPFSFVVGFNAPAALTTVSATAAGKTFPTASYPVKPGEENTLVRVRPID